MTGQTISHYRILDKLGEGGMGVVYKAEDTLLGRTVALKFLHASDDLPRLLREARAAASLNHPNICTVHEVDPERGFLAMEFVEGETLTRRTAGRPLRTEEALALAVQIGEGLKAAHAKGITHRDIKSGNILVTAEGQAKILDFGLARQAGQAALTREGAVAGTPGYMAPEQARGEAVDRRADVWALGAVLHEMLTGRLPVGQTETLPEGLGRVVRKALAADPRDRYQHVDDMLVDLRRITSGVQNGLPAVDVSQHRSQRTRRWVLAAAGAGAASLAGGALLVRRLLHSPQRRTMVAVLPFENIGGDPGEAAFASGLHQDMISVLNRLYPDRLAVIAQTSVRRYQASGASIEQIGRDLKVGYVVEGGVQREGGQVHVTARVIRVKDQTLLWTVTCNRDMGLILAAQSEIAQAIAQGIENGLRPDAQVSAALARPLDAAAHEAYLRGEYAKAVELDPGYAAAYTGMAKSLYYPGLLGFRPPRETFTNMMNAASKALKLDPTQASAHAYLALGQLHLQHNWPEAEEGFRRALHLNPSDPDTRHFLAHLLLWSGRVKESVQECDYALNVDPFDAPMIACLGFHHLQTGAENKALEEALRSLAIDPNDFWGLMTIGWIYERKNMYQEALSAFRKANFRNLSTTLRHLPA